MGGGGRCGVCPLEQDLKRLQKCHLKKKKTLTITTQKSQQNTKKNLQNAL